MRKDRKKKIHFEGGSFNLVELEGKTIKSVVALLIEQRDKSDALQQEWETSQRGKTKAQKEVESTEEERDELQEILDKLETVIKFRLETVFKFDGDSDAYQYAPTTKLEVTQTPEEEKVLRKLLSMVTYHPSKNTIRGGNLY